MCQALAQKMQTMHEFYAQKIRELGHRVSGVQAALESKDKLIAWKLNEESVIIQQNENLLSQLRDIDSSNQVFLENVKYSKQLFETAIHEKNKCIFQQIGKIAELQQKINNFSSESQWLGGQRGEAEKKIKQHEQTIQHLKKELRAKRKLLVLQQRNHIQRCQFFDQKINDIQQKFKQITKKIEYMNSALNCRQLKEQHSYRHYRKILGHVDRLQEELVNGIENIEQKVGTISCHVEKYIHMATSYSNGICEKLSEYHDVLSKIAETCKINF